MAAGRLSKKKRGTIHLSRKFVKFANVHKVTGHITNLCRQGDLKKIIYDQQHHVKTVLKHYTPKISNKYNTVLIFVM